MSGKAALAILMAGLMVWFPAYTVSAGNLPLGKAAPVGRAELNGTKLAAEMTVYPGDTITTGADGIARVLFAQGNQIHVGPSSTAQLSQESTGILVNLEQGALLARSGNGQNIAVNARGLLINPQTAARYEVAIEKNSVIVAANAGGVSVEASNGAYSVPAGKAMRFELAPRPGPQGPGGGKKALVLATLVVGIGLGILAGWIIATERAEDRCLERLGVSPSAPSTVCQF